MNLGLAQDEFDPLGEQTDAFLPKIVRVQVEYIEVQHETMTELLAEPREGTNDTPLRAKLQVLVKEEKAKIIETQMVTARSGQRAMTESINEFIYPVEYYPPEIPCAMPPGSERPAPPPRTGPPTPVVWETRNIGSTLEIDATISQNDKIIDLRLLPTLTYHTGNKVWYEETKGKDTNKVQMPDIYKIQSDTFVTLITGQPFLMSAITPKNDKGETDFTKKILIFVRADVLSAGR